MKIYKFKTSYSTQLTFILRGSLQPSSFVLFDVGREYFACVTQHSTAECREDNAESLDLSKKICFNEMIAKSISPRRSLASAVESLVQGVEHERQHIDRVRLLRDLQTFIARDNHLQ